MSDLFRAELRRFLAWSLVYAGFHAGVLTFLTRLVDLAQQPYEVYALFAAVYALTGLLLGLYQLGGYRRPNAWLNLLHRPLAAPRIAGALLGAGALALAVAVLLPLLLTAGWQAVASPRVLDLRHWLLCVAGLQFSLLGYLAGASAMLVPRRAAAAPLVPLVLVPAAYASGAGALLVQALALAWLLGLVLVVFKPDLSRLPHGPRALLVLAPACVMMWLVLRIAGMGAELLWIAQGSHPNNLSQVVPGSVKEAALAEPDALMVLGLAASDSPQAALWSEQAQISPLQTVAVDPAGMPGWQALTNPAPMEFDDPDRRIRWVFSHDRGRFLGYLPDERQAAGELGVLDGQPFPSPPVPGPGGLLVGRHDVHQYDAVGARVLPRVKLDAGEQIAGLDLDGDRLALLSDRALYLYDARPLQQDESLLQTRQRVPLPGAVGNLMRVGVLELLDGHLVSFTFARLHHVGQGQAYQVLVHVTGDGRTEQVARRELITGYGAIHPWQAWWMSPAIQTTLGALRPLFSLVEPGQLRAPPPRPALTTALGLGGMLLSLLVGLWFVRRTALSTRGRLAWCLACAGVGLPALMCLLWLVPPREAPVPAPDGALATAA